jgi:hypothetical protein
MRRERARVGCGVQRMASGDGWWALTSPLPSTTTITTTTTTTTTLTIMITWTGGWVGLVSGWVGVVLAGSGGERASSVIDTTAPSGIFRRGELSEWSKVLDSKSSVPPKGTAGSNPALSAGAAMRATARLRSACVMKAAY